MKDICIECRTNPYDNSISEKEIWFMYKNRQVAVKMTQWTRWKDLNHWLFSVDDHVEQGFDCVGFNISTLIKKAKAYIDNQ